MSKESRTRFLVIDASSEDHQRERALKENIERVLKTAERLGAEARHIRLCEFEFNHNQSAKRGSKTTPEKLAPLLDCLMWTEVVVIASPVQWGGVNLWLKLFIDQVLSPLEEGGLEHGFEAYGKVAGLLLLCDDDGASALSARLLHMLTHMGFAIPPWGSHYTNVVIPADATEDGWQSEPELIVPGLLKLAKLMRGFPSLEEVVRTSRGILAQ